MAPAIAVLFLLPWDLGSTLQRPGPAFAQQVRSRKPPADCHSAAIPRPGHHTAHGDSGQLAFPRRRVTREARLSPTHLLRGRRAPGLMRLGGEAGGCERQRTNESGRQSGHSGLVAQQSRARGTWVDGP